MRIFISHSSKDVELAAKVCEKVEAGGHSCFLAPRDIRSGCEYAEEIINGIDGSDVLLLLLSQAANDSPHVLREIERAVSKKKSVIVYKLGEVTLSKSMEYFLMTHQWLSSDGGDDFSDIINRINEYAAAHDIHAAAPISEQPAEQKKSEGSAHRRLIPLIIAAAVILAAGLIIGCLLANRAPMDGGENSDTPAVSDAQSAPADITTEQNSSQTTQDESGSEPALTENSEASSQTEPVPTTTPQQTTVDFPQEIPTETAARAGLGDSLLFGTYNGEPIKWRVLRLSDDGTKAVVIADEIITMKAYDAAESGKYNNYDGADYWTAKLSELSPEVQRQIRGDNRWELSNIRTWLNSDRENVSYTGQAPTSKAMAEERNGYHTEAGFLKGFTKAELAAISETEITTNGTVTLDKVFLLSSDELDWLYEADVSVFAKPTAAAVEQDKSGWYLVDCDAYGVDDFFWWLRNANPDNSCECYYINISYSDVRVASGSVGLEGYGIRPVMTLDLTSDAVKAALEN